MAFATCACTVIQTHAIVTNILAVSLIGVVHGHGAVLGAATILPIVNKVVIFVHSNFRNDQKWQCTGTIAA